MSNPLANPVASATKDSWTGLLNPDHPSSPLAYFPDRIRQSSLSLSSITTSVPSSSTQNLYSFANDEKKDGKGKSTLDLLSAGDNNSFSKRDVMSAERDREFRVGERGAEGRG